jgi:tetratricopeptide (TPR) repeat protein
MTAILQRFANIRRDEAGPTFVAGLFFFCVLTALMVVRPAREALGMQRGIEAIRWLFIGTVVVTLLVNPLFGLLVSRFRRLVFINATYLFFAFGLLAFYALFSLVVAHAGTGMLRNLGGDYEAAIGPLERGLVIVRLADIPLLFPLVAAPLGRAYAHLGRTEEGLRLLEDATQRAEEMQWAANHALRLVWLGETYLLADNASAAKRHGARALELARRLGERGHEAYALGLLGEIAASGPAPDPEQASQYYLEGLTLAKTLGMQPLAAALASSLPSPR